MKFGKTRFYADENIQSWLVGYLRSKGFHVEYAIELGFNPRDDEFHLQEAKRRKCILLTKDKDFLDHGRFPFQDLKDTAIIVLETDESVEQKYIYGYMILSLIGEVGYSGNRNINGLKIELIGSKVKLHSRYKGQIKTDEYDTSNYDGDRELFEK